MLKTILHYNLKKQFQELRNEMWMYSQENPIIQNNNNKKKTQTFYRNSLKRKIIMSLMLRWQCKIG